MKKLKLFTAAFLLFMAAGVGAQVDSNVTLTHGSGSKVNETVSIGDKNFTTCLGWGGAGNASTSNNTRFAVTGPCTITVYANGANSATSTANDFTLTVQGVATPNTAVGLGVKSISKTLSPVTWNYTGGSATLVLFSGKACRVYGIYVDYGPAKSNNANLSAINTNGLNGASLTPSFSPSVTEYAAAVPYNYNSGCLMGTKADTKATIDESKACNSNLQVGANTLSITVTAEDGVTKKTYTVVVTREAAMLSNNANLSKMTDFRLTPAFSPDITNYTATLPYYNTEYCLDGSRADTNATIDFTNAGCKALSVGQNTLSLTVTAEDGVTKKTYTVVVTREADTGCQPKQTNIVDSVCLGRPYGRNGFNLPVQNTIGTFTNYLPLVSSQGCDSIVTLNLIVNPTKRITFSDAIYQGQTYFRHGFILPAQNTVGTFTHYLNLITTWGCDSIIALNLTVNPKILDDNTSVEPHQNTATITWQQVPDAGGYVLKIYSDASRSTVICTVYFDANGIVTNITRAAQIYQYTITDLISNTDYYYDLTAKITSGEVLDKTLGSFTTLGATTGINNTTTAEKTITGYYNIMGMKLKHEPQSGSYIIQYNDGSAEKRMRK